MKLICPGFLYRYDPCEYSHPHLPNFGLCDFPTHCLQLQAVWAPEQGVCQVLNIQTSEKSVLVILISDVVLLLMMLVGLLRLRIHGNMFGFRKLLWNQVGNAAPSPDRLYDSREKGVIWLFLATIAEVPPAVRSLYCLYCLELTVTICRRCLSVWI